MMAAAYILHGAFDAMMMQNPPRNGEGDRAR
jgi:hypothetical protein